MKKKYHLPCCILSCLLWIAFLPSQAQISLDPTYAYYFNSISNTSHTVTVTAVNGTVTGAAWQVSDHYGTVPGWLKLSATSGVGATALSIEAEPNPTIESRSTYVYFTIPGTSFYKTIYVYQYNAPLNPAIDYEFSNITYTGSTFAATVQSYGPWVVNALPDWLTVSPQSGASGRVVTITALPNYSDSRYGYPVISNYTGSTELSFYQESNEDALPSPGVGYFTVAKSGETVTQYYNDTASIRKMYYGADWIMTEGISSKVDGLFVATISGNSNNMTVAANSTGVNRATVVTVTGIDNHYYRTFGILQNNIDTELGIEASMPNYAYWPNGGGIYTLTVTANSDWIVSGFYNGQKYYADYQTLVGVVPTRGGAGTTVLTVTLPANGFAYDNSAYVNLSMLKYNGATASYFFYRTATGASLSVPDLVLTSAAGYVFQVAPVTNVGTNEFGIAGGTTLPGWLNIIKPATYYNYFNIQALSANTTTGIRTAAVTVTFTGGGSAIMNLTQVGRNFNTQTSVNAPDHISKNGGVYIVTVTSTVSVRVYSDNTNPPYNDSGYNNGSSYTIGTTLIPVTVPATNLDYTSYDVCTHGSVPGKSYYYAYNYSDCAEVEASGTPTLNVMSPGVVYFGPNEGDIRRIDIESNTVSDKLYTITGIPSWLTFTNTSGYGAASFFPVTNSSFTGTTREATLVVTIAGGAAQSVKVVQAGPAFESTLGINQSYFEFETAKGGTGSFTVDCSSAWSLYRKDDQNFASVAISTLSGANGSTMVNFTVNPAFSVLDHWANYVLIDAFLNSQLVTIKVLGFNQPLMVTAIEEPAANAAGRSMDIYPNPAEGAFTFVAPAAGSAAIFDATGTAVATIACHAGANRIETGLRPGVYFIRFNGSVSRIIVQ